MPNFNILQTKNIKTAKVFDKFQFVGTIQKEEEIFSSGKWTFRKRRHYGETQGRKSDAAGTADEQYP